MIKTVTVTNYLGESLTMDLRKPEESDFVLLSVDGLSPGAATVNISENATGDGGAFNSARLSARNVVLNIIFSWNRLIEDQRHTAYRFFPLKKPVTITVETDRRSASIDGYVESNEVTIFSSLEGAVISIMCPDPLFYGTEFNGVSFSASNPEFQFPYENPSLSLPLTEFSELQTQPTKNIIYTGDMDTGMLIKLHATGDVENVRIYNTGTQEVMFIDTAKLEALTGAGFSQGDDIEISTFPGKKYARLYRGANTYNILNCLGRNVSWFQLTQGDNWFTYTAESGILDLQMGIEYRTAYEGV